MKDKSHILFDLDGTLLPIDMNIFINKYFHILADYFSDLYQPDYFIDLVNKATLEMIKNNGVKTNKEVFEKEFFDLIDLENTSKKTIWDRFNNFYNEEFPTLKKHFEFDNLGNKIVKVAKEKNFKTVVATNPLFPKEAIKTRLNWIDLKLDDFEYVTSYEEMRHCKPNINYYREILDKLNLNPKDCVMVGNDLQDDMIAKKIGIKTFLLEDYKVGKLNLEISPDWIGSRKEFIDYIKNWED